MITQHQRVPQQRSAISLKKFFKLAPLAQVILGATLLFSSTVKAYAPEAAWLKNLISLPDLELVVTPEQDHTALYKAYDQAQKSLKIGIFGISSREMANQIEKQIKRGIKVTIICDKYCTNNERRLEIFNQLKTAGAEIVVATTAFTITHWKMFIIDDKKVFISTMNFISRTNQMRDFGVFTENPDIVKEVVAVYDQDLINAKNNTGLTPELTVPNLVWSPNNSERKLVDLINSAQSTIEIWIENMGNPRIHDALERAVQRKVQVRVLTSICGLGMAKDQAHVFLKDLIKRGVTVKGTPFPATTGIPYIHSKSIHVDREVMFIGSENFSVNSLTKARELGLVFDNNDIENKLHELFEKDWKTAVDIPDEPVLKCEPLTQATEQ